MSLKGQAPTALTDAINLRKVFNLLIKIELEEWNMVSEQSRGQSTVVREFEHRSTAEKLTITESASYNTDIHRNVTDMTVKGSANGKKVDGRLMIAPASSTSWDYTKKP